MALNLPNLVSAVTTSLPILTVEEGIEKVKSMRVVGLAVTVVHVTWKLLRKISLSGNSKNPLLKYLHNILRHYFNHGILMRSEFSAQLPWQFYIICSGRYVIVNYGSYGTVPKKVEQHQIALQHEQELCPDFFNRISLPRMYEESRIAVAKAIGGYPENLVFTDNVTEGMNCAIKSLLSNLLEENDAILCVNLQYSAVLKIAAVYSKTYNIKLIQLDISFPIRSDDHVVASFKDMFKKHKNIKLALLDHISSATALVWPIKKLCKLCRDYGVISVVDAAHAPGQLILNVESYKADVYTGNLHKWYYTPKSCAFIYVQQRFHDVIQPSMVSHACYGGFHERFRSQATKNYSAHITAGYAVAEYMESIGGIEHLHQYITPLVQWAVELYKREWNTEELSVPANMKAPFMRIVYIPEIFAQVYGNDYAGADQMIIDMLDEFKLAIFVNPVQGKFATRVSAQIFSGKSEYYYAARCIKRKAKELEEKYAN